MLRFGIHNYKGDHTNGLEQLSNNLYFIASDLAFLITSDSMLSHAEIILAGFLYVRSNIYAKSCFIKCYWACYRVPPFNLPVKRSEKKKKKNI